MAAQEIMTFGVTDDERDVQSECDFMDCTLVMKNPLESTVLKRQKTGFLENKLELSMIVICILCSLSR